MFDLNAFLVLLFGHFKPLIPILQNQLFAKFHIESFSFCIMEIFIKLDQIKCIA